MKQLTKWAYPTFAGALTLNFVARVLSIVFHRGLSDMGNTFMYHVLTEGVTWPDGPGRYVSAFLQLPSLACRAMGLSPAVILRVYETVITWYPVLSLIACYAILKTRRRLDLLLFPVLSFAIADQISHAFTSGGIHEVISLFWPAFLLLLTTERPRTTDYLAIFPLLVALTFTHESASLFLIFIAACALHLSRKFRGRRSFLLVVGGYSSVAAISCFVRTRLYPPQNVGPFFVFSHQPLPVIAVLVSLLIAAALCLKPKLKPESRRFAALVTVAVLAPLTYFASHSLAWIGLVRACRATSVCLALGFGILAVGRRPREDVRWATLVGASFLAVASIHDIRITLAWARGASFITRTMRDSPGCAVLAQGEVVRELTANGIGDWQVPHLSYLLQEDRHPRSVLFPPKSKGLNPCSGITERGEIDPSRLEEVLHRLRFIW